MNLQIICVSVSLCTSEALYIKIDTDITVCLAPVGA